MSLPVTNPPGAPSRLLMDSIVLFAGNAIGSVMGFAFHLAVARIGGQQVYADLGALISINIILSVSAFSIQTYVASRTAKRIALNLDYRPYLGRTVKKVLTIALPVAVVIALSRPLVANLLNLRYPNGVVVLGLIVLPLFVVSVMRGGLQGAQHFFRLGTIRFVEPAVQLGAGVGFVLLGYGATGAFTGTCLGILATSMLGWFWMRPKFTRDQSHWIDEKDPAGSAYMVQIILFLAFVNIFTNLDVLIVKHHFEGAAAQYTAASYMSRFLYLSALSIGFALFPKTSIGDSQAGLRLLLKAMLYYFCFAFPFWGFVALFPDWVVGLFYGGEYVDTTRLLPRMLFAYLMIGAAYLIGMYRLSRSSNLAWASFAAAGVLQFVLLGFFSDDIFQAAWYMILCSVVALFGHGIRAKKERRE